MLTTVPRGSFSHRARTVRAVTSVLARVPSANWKGRQAASKATANCCASVRAANRMPIGARCPMHYQAADSTVRPARRAMQPRRSARVMVSQRRSFSVWWSACMSSSVSKSKRKRSLSRLGTQGARCQQRRSSLDGVVRISSG